VVSDLVGSGAVAGIREIAEISVAEPVLLPHQLDLARWIADEYMAPLSDVMGAMLPPALKHAHRTPGPNLGPFLLSITLAGRTALSEGAALKRAPRQHVLLTRLDEAGDLLEADLLEGKRSGRGSLAALEKLNYVARSRGPNGSNAPSTRGPRPAPKLSHAQSQAVAAILNADQPRVFLLHGVTGSGKTEVYMAVIDAMLGRGRSAIVMVPEIALTPQALQRFRARFPGMVAAIHSRLAEGERRREWDRLRRTEARIAVGPRSALFAPLDNIGVIVVDEEHDSSYKQAESPRYHARDAAIRLGCSLRIPVILGSATPDVSSYFFARKGRYTLLSLPDRPVWAEAGSQLPAPSSEGWDESSRFKVHDLKVPAQPTTDPRYPVTCATRDSPLPTLDFRPMPAVEIVDLRQELKAGNRDMFSRSLLAALEEAVAARHQAILLLNRRGSATSVVCRDCGHVARCEACDIPLTYHAAAARLICHRCDRRRPIPRRCPACGGSRIRYLGIGTQAVVEAVASCLPAARLLRWDRDVTSKKGAHEDISARFGRHEADVLVGTQMIAKGLDFPLVTLVGVVVADIGLNLPDFRAAERTFQLMTQVAGRAGRADLPSRVVIQAYNPEHYALQAAKAHDYWAFYHQEMTFRRTHGYPPFSRLARMLIRGRSQEIVKRRAEELRKSLLETVASRRLVATDVIGPAPAFVARVNGIFQWQVLVRASELSPILGVVPDDVVVDVDPVDLL